MNNRNSVYFVVVISLTVGLLHFIIGPDYQGLCKDFIRGYLIDILLPMNLYLLLQISLRKKISIVNSRTIGAVFTFLFGTTVEVLQYNKINFLGATYDPLDILIYGIGVALGLILDFTIINRYEKMAVKWKEN